MAFGDGLHNDNSSEHPQTSNTFLSSKLRRFFPSYLAFLLISWPTQASQEIEVTKELGSNVSLELPKESGFCSATVSKMAPVGSRFYIPPPIGFQIY
mmetsp:Transcript_3083/g.8479  ORF Transcript_3083/g.8479 Transcript_3083/m.8479 type:complete len:97 (-) Transcript_3083:503-793(-)